MLKRFCDNCGVEITRDKHLKKGETGAIQLGSISITVQKHNGWKYKELHGDWCSVDCCFEYMWDSITK